MLNISTNLCKFSVRKDILQCSRILNKFLSTQVEEEYSSEPKYPEILDVSPEAVLARERAQWHEKIKNHNTIEEKQIEINMPRYYGWNCNYLNEGKYGYNSLPFAQYITHTHVIDGSPAFYNSQTMEEAATQHANEIKNQFIDAMLFELQRELPIETEEGVEEREIDKARSLGIVEQLNSLFCSTLGKYYPHLKESRSDPLPRVEAAWKVGGIEAPRAVKSHLKREEETEEEINKPRNRHFQYFSNPLLQIRSTLPLQELMDYKDCENLEYNIPDFTYDPKVLDGESRERRHITNIPGFWPGEKHQFGLISYHSRSHLIDRPSHFDDIQETLKTQGILSSYGWLLPQACYLGFSTFNDITYPLVSQTVITNGKLWSLFAYQLNTTIHWGDNAKTNPKKNICWSINDSTQLFDKIEDGKFIGFNDDILKNLVKFYINEPMVRQGVEMRPYLNENCSRLAEMEDEERRAYYEKTFKFMMSNRPRFLKTPEIHPWEVIYKLKFQTRPLDPRKRFFELWQNPYIRRFDDFKPHKLRKRERKHYKDRYQKKFFP